MKISDFIEGRDLNYDTVRRYIKRNPELFNGHIGHSQNIVLDDEAVKLLEEKYPLPTPVQVIQDTTSREKLQELQEKYINLLEENNRLTQENANLKLLQHKQLLLEQQIQEKECAIQKALDEIRECDEQIAKLQKRAETTEAATKFIKEQLKIAEFNLQIEKNKSWLAKLLRK